MIGDTIRLDIPKLAELKDCVESPRTWIAGLPWYLSVASECSEHTGNVKMLSVCIYCNSESEDTNWSCESTDSSTFNFEDNSSGYSFMDWDDVLNPEKGFIREDGGIVIEASITVKDVIGVHPIITDTVLLIEDKRLHIGKQLLSTFSPIFYAKFYKDPEEKDKEEIKLDEVVFEEFVELLHVIYPTHKPVTAETVDCLLRLGDRFMMEVVMRECTNFLCGPESDGISLGKKLLFADKYHLLRLQFLCLESLKTIEEVMALKGKSEYGEFSGEMKAALLERIFKLTCSEATQRCAICWDDVLKPGNCFIREDGGIVIEASITVKDVTGALSTPIYDFTTQSPNITDVVIIIGDKSLHVGKQILCTFSPDFYGMFYKDFVEMDVKEIKLDDVDFDEFVQLLHVIYRTRKPVTAKTVECLLRLGDRFKMEVVLRECTQFLCGPESNGIPLEKKLLFADWYALGRFLCLESLKTFDEVRALKGKREYGDFSSDMKAALLERIFMITP